MFNGKRQNLTTMATEREFNRMKTIMAQVLGVTGLQAGPA
jgi:hypothetical protein